jgi:Na+-transporting methylmalonyl-CoA/oxaloacetate decarboxylase gamma subunit
LAAVFGSLILDGGEVRTLGVAAGFVLLGLLVYGAWYFSEPQREHRALMRKDRAIRKALLDSQALEEKERAAGIYPIDGEDR